MRSTRSTETLQFYIQHQAILLDREEGNDMEMRTRVEIRVEMRGHAIKYWILPNRVLIASPKLLSSHVLRVI